MVRSGLPPPAHVNVALPGACFKLLVESAQLLRVHLSHTLLFPFLPCLIFHDLQKAQSQSGAQHHVSCDKAIPSAPTEESAIWWAPYDFVGVLVTKGPFSELELFCGL